MKTLKDTGARRASDMAYLADIHINIVSCPGGRPIAEGFICPHCNVDPSIEKCKQPLEGWVK